MNQLPRNIIEDPFESVEDVLARLILKRRVKLSTNMYAIDSIPNFILRDHAGRLNQIHDFWYGNKRIAQLRMVLAYDTKHHSELGMPKDTFDSIRRRTSQCDEQLKLIEDAIDVVQRKLLDQQRSMFNKTAGGNTHASIIHDALQEKDNER